MTTVSTRRPTIRFQRLHGWPPGLQYAIYWNGTRAGNGDGIPGGPIGSIDWVTPIFGPAPVWPAGQAVMFGGGFGDGGFGMNNANAALGLGFGDQGFGDGEFGVTGGQVAWQFPFDLRDGEMHVAVRLFDVLGNPMTTADVILAFTIAAPPRPDTRGRMEGYDAAKGQTQIAWQESPDFLTV